MQGQKINYLIKFQKLIIEEQLNILLNETENLISIVLFFLNKEKKDAHNINVDIRKIEESFNKKMLKIYSGNEKIKRDEKREEKKELLDIYSALVSQKRKILELQEYLRLFHKNIHNFLETEKLIFHSLLFDHINNILKSLNVLVKALKFRRENAYQSYIPYPLLHRRYRLYNLHYLLREQIEEIIKSFGLSKVNFVISSDYDIGDIVTEEFPLLVRGSFFWREQVILCPLLVHEIAHGIYKKRVEEENRERLDRSIKEIQQKIRTPIFPENVDLLRTIWKDIFADLISYEILGDAYLLSLLCGGLLGYGYYQFNKPDSSHTPRFDFIPSNLVHTSSITHPERAILRIITLLSFREKKNTNNKIEPDNDWIRKQTLQLINDFYPVSKKNGIAFSLLTRDKRMILEFKASLLNVLSLEFLELFLQIYKELNLEKAIKKIKKSQNLNIFYYINPKKILNFIFLMIP